MGVRPALSPENFFYKQRLSNGIMQSGFCFVLFFKSFVFVPFYFILFFVGSSSIFNGRNVISDNLVFEILQGPWEGHLLPSQ